MNKFSKILYAAMALAMAVCNFSCSDDEELPTGDLELNSGSSVTTETLKGVELQRTRRNEVG